MEKPEITEFVKQVNRYTYYIHMWAEGKGWWPDPAGNADFAAAQQLAKIGLFSEEIGELITAVRKPGQMSEHIPDMPNLHEEAADIAIRLMDFCGHYNIPLGEAIVQKMVYNETRSHRHGGKLA